MSTPRKTASDGTVPETGATARSGAPSARRTGSAAPAGTPRPAAGAGKPGAGRTGAGGTGAGRGGGGTGAGGAGGSEAGRGGAGGTGAGGAGGSGAGRGGGGKSGAGKAGGGKAQAGGTGRVVPPPPGPGLVVGTVPALARVAGAVALPAALLLLIAPAFPLAEAGDTELGSPGNLFAFVPPLPLVAVVAAAGLLAATGRLPRLGLAALFPAGTYAAGVLLRTLYLLRTSDRSTLDLPLGVGDSRRYEAAAGLTLTALGAALLVLAAVLAAVAWPRTIMEDTGDLDPRRPRLAAWGLAAGVLTALVLGMAPYASDIAPGASTLPERSGLDLLGALVIALGAAAWAVLAATLRPRLAVVGVYFGLAAALLTEGLSIALLVARSERLGPSAGGVGVLLAAVAAAALGLVAARLGRSRPA